MISPLLKVTDLPGRGRGYVATRAIMAGELLLCEVPFTAAYVRRLDVVRAVLLEERFSRLCFDSARPLATCHPALAAEGVSDECWSDACARVRANVFMTHEGALCIYGAVSFFNHSCDPAATLFTKRGCDGLPGLLRPPLPSVPSPTQQPTKADAEAEAEGTAQPEAEEARVFAIRNIEVGEEVTIAYRADWLTFPVLLRRRLLRHSWHFECDCARCVAEQAQLAVAFQWGQPASQVPPSPQPRSAGGALDAALLVRAAKLYPGIDAGGDAGDGDIHPSVFRRADVAMSEGRLAELRALLSSWPPAVSLHWVRTVVRAELLAWTIAEGGTMGAGELCALLQEQVLVEQALLPRLHHFRLRAARALVAAARHAYRASDDDGIDWTAFEEMEAIFGIGVGVGV